MSDGMMLITSLLLLASNVMTLWRCNILSRRIDTVHERITLTNRMNGLKNGCWDDLVPQSAGGVGGTNDPQI